MSHKTLAYIGVAAYALLLYSVTTFGFPRKCSEHTTPEEKLRRAIAAPFSTILMTGMAVMLMAAVNEIFFQP